VGDQAGASIGRLWAGDTTHYPSASEADLALCAHLSFWTGRDPERIDRLFRSSGLMRGKWERRDYRERTIGAAIEGTTEVFDPSARNVTPPPRQLDPSIQEKRGVPTDFPGGCSSCDLEAILEVFGELLVMPDHGAVEISLASIVANYAHGDAVLALLVGPSGCGKSEIVTALTKAPSVWALRA
jgi:hypothetical protein